MSRIKLERLKKRLRDLDAVVVAFSGGVDSTFLMAVARETLCPDRVLAVTAESEIHPPAEIGDAKRLARAAGVRHRIVRSGDMQAEDFLANPPERCYLCKKRVFAALQAVAAEAGFGVVADGTNADDAGDYRPGRRALEELGVVSPLAEAGLTKREIRTLSKRMGLPTWNRPALACLATRIPYGTRITPELLRRIDAAETFLRRAGFVQVRVRDHGNLARLEVAKDEAAKLRRPGLTAKIARRFKALGYAYVTLDLEGYRTGSLNETLGKSR